MIERLVSVTAFVPAGLLGDSPEMFSARVRSRSDPWSDEWEPRLYNALRKRSPRLHLLSREQTARVALLVSVVDAREIAQASEVVGPADVPTLTDAATQPFDLAGAEIEVIEPAPPMQDALRWVPKVPRLERAR